MSLLAGFDIRYTESRDFLFLRQWMAVAEVVDWFPIETDQELEDFLRVWIGFCRCHSSLTAVVEGVPCGMAVVYLMPYQKVFHHAVGPIVVDPKWQRRGIGNDLIRNLKHLAKKFFSLEMLGMEVMDGSPLLSLLERNQFVEVFRQEGFFKKMGQDRSRIFFEALL